jgi:phosphatidylglycerophosphatase A
MVGIINKIAQVMATLFFVGHSPIMPGSCGSLVTVLGLFLLPTVAWYVCLGAIVVLFLIGWWAADRYAKQLQKNDPSCIVIDELVGMMITLFIMPKSVVVYASAFVVFRLFDIVKPFPINILERRVHGGLGIMLDDVLAGCMAWIVVGAMFLR